MSITIALTVTVVWAASMAADLILRDKYDPNPLIHAAMMVVLGAVFGIQVVKR